MTIRALTDRQNEIAEDVVFAIAGHRPDDVFAAFASIMAATINNQAQTETDALARAEMWGQRFLDLLVQGRKGAFKTAASGQVYDTRFIL